MPVTWGAVHQLHASLFYTIEALKLDSNAHSAVFVSMHKEGNFLSSPKAVKDFLKGFGIAPELAEKYLDSFTVKQKVSRAKKHAKQLKVSATPVMIVDGKYMIEPRGSYEKILQVVDYVIELQKPNS
jgi:thiol:disulfide interchange protein DsbA